MFVISVVLSCCTYWATTHYYYYYYYSCFLWVCSKLGASATSVPSPILCGPNRLGPGPKPSKPSPMRSGHRPLDLTRPSQRAMKGVVGRGGAAPGPAATERVNPGFVGIPGLACRTRWPLERVCLVRNWTSAAGRQRRSAEVFS